MSSMLLSEVSCLPKSIEARRTDVDPFCQLSVQSRRVGLISGEEQNLHLFEAMCLHTSNVCLLNPNPYEGFQTFGWTSRTWTILSTILFSLCGLITKTSGPLKPTLSREKPLDSDICVSILHLFRRRNCYISKLNQRGVLHSLGGQACIAEPGANAQYFAKFSQTWCNCPITPSRYYK